MTLHFLTDVAKMLNQLKIENYAVTASLKSETMCKLIYRMLGLRLLISSLPGWPQECMLNRLASLAYQQAISKPYLVNLISKDTHLAFFIPWQAS